jgi:hypothetical protein
MPCIIWKVLFFGQEDGHSCNLIMITSALIPYSPVQSLFCIFLVKRGLWAERTWLQYMSMLPWTHLEPNRGKLLIVLYGSPFLNSVIFCNTSKQ